jgi:transposase
MTRGVVSDEAWAVIGPLFPSAKSTGCPPVDRRTVVEAAAWRFRTGAPWRDLPERFGNWNTIYKNFNRWAADGVWARVLEAVQSLAQQRGDQVEILGRGSDGGRDMIHQGTMVWQEVERQPGEPGRHL